MRKPSILVTGAGGQIGQVLCSALAKHYGSDAILATDIRAIEGLDMTSHKLDILDDQAIAKILSVFPIKQIYHLAAILSAKGEQNPQKAWKVNMDGLLNILEAGRHFNVEKIFYPSSIAVFGPLSLSADLPIVQQHALLDPHTVYGISKSAGELWAQYYYNHFGLDVRSLRYPGIISHQTEPGGGTTDYAVDIYHAAVKGETFRCFLKPDTSLPMIYMEDAIRATLELMSAPAESIRIRTSYNLAGMSFAPSEVYASIKKHKGDFKIEYHPDFRQQIAESWPDRIDDAAAKRDWAWSPAYDLDKMTADMLLNLSKRYGCKEEPMPCS